MLSLLDTLGHGLVTLVYPNFGPRHVCEVHDPTVLRCGPLLTTDDPKCGKWSDFGLIRGPAVVDKTGE